MIDWNDVLICYGVFMVIGCIVVSALVLWAIRDYDKKSGGGSHERTGKS